MVLRSYSRWEVNRSVIKLVSTDGNNIVGAYMGPSGGWQGFLYENGTYISIDVPGAVETWVTGIEGDTIVGSDLLEGGFTQGFIATPVPEPSTLAFLAIGTTASTLRRMTAYR